MDEEPEKRAISLHSLIKHLFTRNKNTTAVLNTKEKISIVGSSEKRLRPEVRAGLKENEIEATGPGHAEEKVIKKAEIEKLHPTEIGVSRPICLDCKSLILQKDIQTKTNFSGKKSKNRENEND
ncbi:MAG: hypothetical protein H7A25_16355 [Leptospiraceae bacterium]|nr:hypothetical protein [Leptospiraceae bacterium]MCP5501475.1 hypothetical protein [Leptospiraceae bacterium]